MMENLAEWSLRHRDAMQSFLRNCFATGRALLLQSDLQQAYAAQARECPEEFADSPFEEMVKSMQEGVFQTPWALLVLRDGPGRSTCFKLHLDHPHPEAIPVADYLAFKERLVQGDGEPVLEVDFGPFRRDFPRMTESRSIGQGVLFLNRHLSGELFKNPKEGQTTLLHFLRLHALEGRQLMLFEHIRDVAGLRAALRRALGLLEKLPEESPWSGFGDKLAALGFAPGWGANAGRVAETMGLLSDILEAPSPQALESFLARIPMISRLLILSPHGWFAQDHVLGRPDTGGQIVYILDQVRALEKEMRSRLAEQGVAVEPRILVATRLIPDADGTTCDQPLEKIHGCDSAHILRVPIRRGNGEVLRHWISRFEIWPWLESFAADVEREALAHFGGHPDLVIGNYSDGNLVASLIAQRLGVTQCNIAHALEKSKYLHSALYWRDNEAAYHFSCQYTADLIAMNSADFIITSTYQEIAGTAESVGQYESYQHYTMPGLYRVLNGMDVFDPRFNIVSPGADADIYFSFRDEDRRLRSLLPQIEKLLFADDPGVPWRGHFIDPERPILFTMARLDRVKNLAGLADWFGRCERLSNMANLLVIGGHVDPNASGDREERQQIEAMHHLMDRHGLDGRMRWLGTRLDKGLSGELYRVIADRRGAFVQPALFEAFGLTVIEAMASGLPVFVTRYGGPLEIVKHGVSGFHIDPNDGAQAAEIMADFLEHGADQPALWDKVSDAALARVRSHYTWALYAQRMMTLSRIYGFWKFVSKLERGETNRYLQMFYHLQFRPLAKALAQ